VLIVSGRFSVLVVVLQVAKVSDQDEVTDCGHVSAVDRPGKTSKICALTVLPLG
jgi:hypothetical protein